MRPLLQILSALYGTLIVVLLLVLVGGAAALGLHEGTTTEARPAARRSVSPTPDGGIDQARANPALPVTTIYLVYSQQQARAMAEIHERTVSSSPSRRFSDTFARAVVLPVATAEENIAAKDVIDRAYADYFAGRGSWVTVIDTANWCRHGTSAPQTWLEVPKELAQVIPESCGPD